MSHANKGRICLNVAWKCVFAVSKCMRATIQYYIIVPHSNFRCFCHFCRVQKQIFYHQKSKSKTQVKNRWKSATSGASWVQNQNIRMTSSLRVWERWQSACRSTGTGLKAGVPPAHSCARAHNSPVPGMSTFHHHLSLSLCLTYFTISLPGILLTSHYTYSLSLVLFPCLPLASCFYLALLPPGSQKNYIPLHMLLRFAFPACAHSA